MSKARLIITAVAVEAAPSTRSPAPTASANAGSAAWSPATTPRRGRVPAPLTPPKTSPTAIPPATVTLITERRGKLTSAGLDAGPDIIAWHLATTTAPASRWHHQPLPDPARAGHPPARKRPTASYQRLQAELANQCWQADFTHDPLAGPPTAPAGDAEILTWTDDHSRDALDVTATSP